MKNPFRDWNLAKVQAHNSRVGKLPPKIDTAASLLASMRERETKKKTQALADANAKASHLEIKFLVREHRFHPERKWRFDFAHPASRTAIEIEGGIWNGRHTRGDGFQKDAEKYFEAHIRGWRVVRLTPNLITPENLRALAMRMSI
jgi:very-short-patch-repair endonuclease